MPFEDIYLAPLESIPVPPYSTPSDNLPFIYVTAKKMEALCIKLKGMGLAAAQVGLPWKMFVVSPHYSKEFQCYFDCDYEPMSGDKFSSVEGCLSLPGQHYVVDRHEIVRVSGMRLLEDKNEPKSEPFSEEFRGLMAVLMQHEIDHQMGRERMIDVIGRRVQPA